MRPAFKLIAVITAVLSAAPAAAKLPEASDAAKAQAALAAAKAAWGTNVASYQLCQAMNRTAEHYRSTAKAADKSVAAPVDTPPCSDPGQFIAPSTELPLNAATGTPNSQAAAAGPQSPAKNTAPPPLESAGAHSPPATAIAPPSSKPTDAELRGQPKK